jgi:hypothetical protein
MQVNENAGGWVCLEKVQRNPLAGWSQLVLQSRISVGALRVETFWGCQ